MAKRKTKAPDNNLSNKNRNSILKDLGNIRKVLDGLELRKSGTTDRNRRSIDLDKNETDKILNVMDNGSVDRFERRSPINLLKTMDSVSGDIDNTEVNDMISDITNFKDISQLYNDQMNRNFIYDDYELIMKFMPQLKSIIRDTIVPAIISPNDHTKSFLNISVTGDGDLSKDWSPELKKIQENNKINVKIKKLIEDVCTYGKQPVRVKPYRELLTSMMREIDQMEKNDTPIKFGESYNSIQIDDNVSFLTESLTSISENYNDSVSDLLNADEFRTTLINNANSIEISHVDNTEAYEELLAYYQSDKKVKKIIRERKDKFSSICESYADSGDIDSAIKGSYTSSGKSSGIKNKVKIADALFVTNTVSNDDKDLVNVPGTYYKQLPIRNLIKVEAGSDMCMGYYLIDVKMVYNNDMSTSDANMLTNPYKALTMKDIEKTKEDEVESVSNVYYKKLSDLLVKRLNKKNLEANSNFKEQIVDIFQYYKLNKNNSKVKVVFIPADEIIEVKINNGISLLDDSLFPAKLYVTLLLSNIMLKLIRSADKRVYYIKQGIDSNVTNTLMQTITQIKKSELSLSDLGNLNKIFGYLGRFNDYFVSTSPDGDRPFDFEIMSGQDVEIKDELMEELKKTAIIVLGTPYGITEYDDRTDLATRLVSDNIRFANQIVYKQIELSPELSQILTEFMIGEHPTFDKEVLVNLPRPINLKLDKLSTQINSFKEIAEVVAETLLIDEEDEDYDITKKLLIKEVIKDMTGGLLDWEDKERLKKNVELKIKELRIKKSDGDSDDDSGGGGW